MKGSMSRMELLKSASVILFHAGFVFSLLTTLLVRTAPAQTTQPSDNFDQQIYGGFGLGVSELDPDSMCPCLTVGDGRDQAFTVFLGVDLASRLSVEGFYADLGEAGIQFNGTDAGTIEYQVGGISALGYLFGSRLGDSGDGSSALSAREGVSAYIRLGVGIMENDSALNYDRDHKVHLHTGLGLEYGWANGIAIRGEVAAYDSDAAFAGVTVLKRFGKKTRRATPEEIPFTVIADPDARPVQLVPSQLVNVEPKAAYFAYGKSELTPQAMAMLDVLSVELAKVKTGTIAIEGHTDEIASEAFNMMLSINRAASVKKYLRSKGVDAMRMEISGFGETRPVASNLTIEGRKLNRRVEINLR